MTAAVILVAAGSGSRLGAGMPKAFAPLCGESLLAHALRGVLGCADVGHVVIVAPAFHIDQCQDVVDHARLASPSRPSALSQPSGDAPDVDIPVDVVLGGADRIASVEAGLAALRPDDDIVLVHDVARCLAPSDLFARVIRAVSAEDPAVVPGLPVTDTVKMVDGHGGVLQTPDRGSLRSIQTPQGFLREVLEKAHANARGTAQIGAQTSAQTGAQTGAGSATDDAGLVERSGGQVRVVAGDHRAFKITSPLDLAMATALLQNGSDGSDGSYAG